MKKPKDPSIFLGHILDNIEKIENGIRNMSEAEYAKNVDIQDATVRRVEVIGEAVKNLPLAFRKNIHPLGVDIFHNAFSVAIIDPSVTSSVSYLLPAAPQ